MCPHVVLLPRQLLLHPSQVYHLTGFPRVGGDGALDYLGKLFLLLLVAEEGVVLETEGLLAVLLALAVPVLVELAHLLQVRSLHLQALLLEPAH
jgi:hypothetical protein